MAVTEAAAAMVVATVVAEWVAVTAVGKEVAG